MQLQVVDGRLRADFPAGTRTPDRTDAIRSERDRLIDLASRSPAVILTTLSLAGIIVSLEGEHIRVEGNLSGLTAGQRGEIRFYRDPLIDALQRELSACAMVVGRVWTIIPEILESRPEELDAFRLELVNCPADDPATPEEWAALARARQVQAGSTDQSIDCD